MGERIAAIAALSRVRAVAVEAPAPPLSAALPSDTIAAQSLNDTVGSRVLQEISGLRQTAETTSQGVTLNTNAQRADVVGSELSRQAESAVSALSAAEAQRAIADAASPGDPSRISLNRVILEALRGGFETARKAVPTIEQQRTAIREALRVAREELPFVPAGAQETAMSPQVMRQSTAALAEQGMRQRTEDAYASTAQASGSVRLNFLV